MFKIIIFGTGKVYEKTKNELFKNKDLEISCLIDNDINKQGKIKDGILIKSPKEIKNIQFDYIIIMSINIKEMYQQIVEYGVQKQKIVIYNNLSKLRKINSYKMYYNNKIEKSKKTVLIIVHELLINGATLAAFEVGKVFNEKGFEVSFLSIKDGNIQDDYDYFNEIIVSNYTDKKNIRLWKWIESFDVILVNTLEIYHMINDLNKLNKNIYWWLHESEFIFERYGKIMLKDISLKNINVLAVSERVDLAINKFLNVNKVKRFYYGIKDWNIKNLKGSKNKIIIAIVGGIYYYKGQDLIVRLLENLEDKLDEFEIVIIGKLTEANYCKDLIQKCSKYKNIKFTDNLNREELRKIYEKTDVVLSTSRQDSMPIALTEGLINKKAIIASTGTGTSDLITHKVNGLIFESENVEQLTSCIKYLLEDKNRIKKIGIEGRKLYKKYFSIDVFEKNIKEVFKLEMLELNE